MDECLGRFTELIALLEQGIMLDRAHQGIYTQLGVAYCKYKEEKVMEHVKLFWSKLNIPQLLEACKENFHWKECVFLYSHYDQFDTAVDVLITNSTECWEHELFKQTIKQVANVEYYYKGCNFYLTEHPLELNDLLMELHQQLDHIKVVSLVKNAGALPLIKKYLLYVQTGNTLAVNEALNNMYLEEDNYTGLRESIDTYDQFDQTALAIALENHELLEFRRISAQLFKLAKKWDRSIEISKKDKLWADAMESTAASGSEALAEELLKYFINKGEKECFSACLCTCYELIRPDVVLEMAWRHDLMSFAMPFMVQCFREFDTQLKTVKGKLQAQEDAVKAEQEAKKQTEQEKQQTDAAFVGTGETYNPMMAPWPWLPRKAMANNNRAMANNNNSRAMASNNSRVSSTNFKLSHLVRFSA